jgi:hypothetical protein
MTPLECVLACQDLYQTPPVGFDQVFTTDDVVVGMRLVGRETLVVMRGSVTVEDWLRDAEIIPVYDPQLGFCHKGFLEGLQDVFLEIQKALSSGTSLTITGHSLGGARARLLAAKCLCNGVPVAAVTVFGSPRPAFRSVADLFEAHPELQHTSYRNRQDIVTDAPPPWMLYSHTEQYFRCDSGTPEAGEVFEGPEDHHIALYVRAISQLP